MWSGRIEVHAVARLEGVGVVAVTNLQIALEQVQELITGVNVRAHLCRFSARNKLGKIRVELAIGNHIREALEIVGRVIDAGLGQTDTLRTAMQAEERMRLRLEEVGEIAAKDHGNAREIAQGGDDASGFKLREKTRGEAGMAAEFDKAHGALEAEAADSLADTLFCNKGLGRVGGVGHGIEMGRRRFELACHGSSRRIQADLG